MKYHDNTRVHIQICYYHGILLSWLWWYINLPWYMHEISCHIKKIQWLYHGKCPKKHGITNGFPIVFVQKIVISWYFRKYNDITMEYIKKHGIIYIYIYIFFFFLHTVILNDCHLNLPWYLYHIILCEIYNSKIALPMVNISKKHVITKAHVQ